MAIKSSDFGPVRLSGEDAKAFAEQPREAPSPAAVRMVKLAHEYSEELARERTRSLTRKFYRELVKKLPPAQARKLSQKLAIKTP